MLFIICYLSLVRKDRIYKCTYISDRCILSYIELKYRVEAASAVFWASGNTSVLLPDTPDMSDTDAMLPIQTN